MSLTIARLCSQEQVPWPLRIKKIDRRKGLGKKIRVEGEGTVNFRNLDFGNCRDFKVIVGNIYK